MKANSDSYRKKSIIIGGGVGPAAGLDLHRHVIELTPTDGSDQDHLRVIHLSFSDLIPDRTDSILNRTGYIPAERMAELINQAGILSRKYGSESVVGIPCNTFHAPEIFSRFKENLDPSIEVLNMIDECIAHITSVLPSGSKVGILSTTGTRRTRLYDDPLERAGFTAFHVKDQESIHSAIYNPEWGIKATSGATERNRTVLSEALDELAEHGAEAVILGCTELPLVLTENTYLNMILLNPMRILAGKLVEAALQQPLSQTGGRE